MNSAEPNVTVNLKGGPDGMPATVSIRLSELSSSRLKIPFKAGYEHFVLVGGTPEVPVFLWCDRTKVAE
jgi:hypothetical protein